MKAEEACAWHLHRPAGLPACQPATKDRGKDKAQHGDRRAQAKQASWVGPGRDEGRVDAENTWLAQAEGSSLRPGGQHGSP